MSCFQIASAPPPAPLFLQDQRHDSSPRASPDETASLLRGRAPTSPGSPALSPSATLLTTIRATWFLLRPAPESAQSPKSCGSSGPFLLRAVSVPPRSTGKTSPAGCSPTHPTLPPAAHAVPAGAARDTARLLPHAALLCSSHGCIPQWRSRASRRRSASSGSACRVCRVADRPALSSSDSLD